MNLRKVNKLVSLSPEMWNLVKQGIQNLSEIENDINKKYKKYVGDDKHTHTQIQGAVSTKTMINPKFVPGEDILFLDVALEFTPTSSNFKGEKIEELKNIVIQTMKDKFGKTTDISIKEKSTVIEFEIIQTLENGKKIKLDFDFSIMAIRGDTAKIINFFKKDLIEIDPKSLIFEFNGVNSMWIMKYRDFFPPRTVLKTLKALRNIKIGTTGFISSTLLMNAVLKAFKQRDVISWKQVIIIIEEQIEELNKNGVNQNVSNPIIFIKKNKDFNYEKSIKFISFLKSIKTDDDILKILESSKI